MLVRLPLCLVISFGPLAGFILRGFGSASVAAPAPVVHCDCDKKGLVQATPAPSVEAPSHSYAHWGLGALGFFVLLGAAFLGGLLSGCCCLGAAWVFLSRGAGEPVQDGRVERLRGYVRQAIRQ